MPRRSPRASDPHTGHVIIRFHGSPIQSPSSKNPDIGFDRTSGSSSTNPQPTLSSKHPEPALRYGKPIPNRFKQITRVTVYTNQAPAKSSKSHMPATGGGVPSPPACAYLHVRPWSCAHGQCHSHARPCSYLYGLCARPRQRPGTLLTRPAYGLSISSANPIHSNALRLRNTSADLQSNRYSKRLGGMGTASPRDAATTGALRSSWPEGRRLWRGSPGQAGLDKSPQMWRQGNRIRRTDDGSRRSPARPGVMLALRRWGTVSLSF